MSSRATVWAHRPSEFDNFLTHLGFFLPLVIHSTTAKSVYWRPLLERQDSVEKEVHPRDLLLPQTSVADRVGVEKLGEKTFGLSPRLLDLGAAGVVERFHKSDVGIELFEAASFQEAIADLTMGELLKFRSALMRNHPSYKELKSSSGEKRPHSKAELLDQIMKLATGEALRSSSGYIGDRNELAQTLEGISMRLDRIETIDTKSAPVAVSIGALMLAQDIMTRFGNRSLTILYRVEDPKLNQLMEDLAARAETIAKTLDVVISSRRDQKKRGEYSRSEFLQDILPMTEDEQSYFVDRLLRVGARDSVRLLRETRGGFRFNFPDGQHGYSPSSTTAILDALTVVQEIKEKKGKPVRFLDVGCGLGKVNMLADWLVDDLHSMGLEYTEEFATEARKLAGEYGIDAEIINGDAKDFDYSQADVLYLFNPFHHELLAQVVDQIDKTRPEELVICSTGVCSNYLDSLDWLERQGDRTPGGVDVFRAI